MDMSKPNNIQSVYIDDYDSVCKLLDIIDNERNIPQISIGCKVSEIKGYDLKRYFKNNCIGSENEHDYD